MKYLVSSKVKEETKDILDILEKNNILKTEIILYLHIELKHQLNLVNYQVIYYKIESINTFKSKLIETIQFVSLVFKVKPDYLYTGFPIIKYRLASLLLNIHYTAYLRGLMFNPTIYSGIGEKLRYGRFSFLFKSRLFNTYDADQIITISEINKQFINSRGIPENKISLISPPWLDKPKLKQNEKIETIVFISQAFTHHGFQTIHSSQINFLEKLIRYAHFHNLSLIIRQHPRDFHNYDSYLRNNVSINKESSEKFLNDLNTSYILISPLSTFAFEAIYLGLKVKFYSTKELDKLYLESFNNLNISPIYTLDKHIDINTMKTSKTNLFY